MSLKNKVWSWSLCAISFFTFSCTKETGDIQTGGEIEIPVGEGLSTIQLVDGNNVYGHIVDHQNKAIAGVVVSDGYSVVQTNEQGEYQFKKHPNASFVFYSTPENYQVFTYDSRRVASFYQKLAKNENPSKYDFKLTALEAPENKFLLVAIGDPQVASDAEVARFQQETIEDMKLVIAEKNIPAYGISLGDVVADKSNLLNTMKTALGSTAMPVFTTIGNHDKVGGSATVGRTGEIFESHFGPSNYSFNRGNVHFVCLDNVVYSNKDSYSMGLNEEQMNWLEKDLSYVSKDKLLIVYYHMPLRNTNFITRARFIDLIKGFKEVHLMAGHTHYNENYILNVDGKEIYEHIHAATCGAWWKSTINGDGTPNGYAVYEIDNNTIKNWYYKSTRLPADYQLRLHWGNASFGGQYGMFTYGKSAKTLVANVWNADPQWKIEVHMDGKKLGDMVLTTAMNRDAWSMGYHLGVLNRNPDNYSTTTKHLYTFEVSEPNSTLKVVATDRFGKVYEQSYITTDLTAAIGY